MTLEVATQIVQRLRVSREDTLDNVDYLVEESTGLIRSEVHAHAALRPASDYDIDIIVNIVPLKG